MANISVNHAILFLYLLLQVSSISCTNALKGFSTKLIHRDSPESPFYDASISSSERLAGAIHRSMSRLSHFKLALNLTNYVVNRNKNMNTTIVPGHGEYLMEISIGTPPVKQFASADTGSDVTWTQCMPCINCFQQDQPIYNSKKSSTFRALTCGSRLCEELKDLSKCSERTKSCEYQLFYGDQSTSAGVLALETYRFGGISIPNMTYGCSRDSQGTFQPDSAGIIGLGGGPLSLINQLGNSIQGKFSYCLTSDRSAHASSSINFGSNAIVSGSGVMIAPMVKKSSPTHYYLTLEAISVDDKKISFPILHVVNGDKGNIIIDSGTTLTILPSLVYQNLEEELKNAIHATPVKDPQGLLSLCYNDDESFKPPRITAHFYGGANLALPPKNTFVLKDKLLCLAMMPDDHQPIYGNLAQMDFLIGYDLQKGAISFKPTDCSKA